jgi:uncharacterized FAD-dependent dehydrogenase
MINCKTQLLRWKEMAKEVRFKLPYDHDVDQFIQEKYLNDSQGNTYQIMSRSLDARGANRGKKPCFHYQVVLDHDESYEIEKFPQFPAFDSPPIIVGAGPAGLFAALRFQEFGIPTIILERGDNTHERMKKIGRYWRYGEFDADNNVCYGEGGAGLFSDGKLITRVKSPYVKYVMKKLVELGAPKEILYDSNPHVGSNKIRQLIKNISKYLIDNGHQIILKQRVTELLYSEDNKNVIGVKTLEGKEYRSEQVLLAVGHSARSMYQHLNKNQVQLKAKDFSIGVRIEHPREQIDRFQFGDYAADPRLGAARYRLSWHDRDNDRGCYSFCMCPGGYVLSSGTREDHLVVNGMSNYGCNSRWSNSAIVVSIKNGIDFNRDETNIMEGIDFQAKVENDAFNLSKEKASGKEVPYQRMIDYLDGKSSPDQVTPKNSVPSGIFHYPLFDLLPEQVNTQLQKAFIEFDKNMPGYLSKDALLFAPETRTSSPVTIVRDPKSLQSASHNGLYPLGEGAGYAGGITSAAVDGIKAVMAILESKKLYVNS